MGLLTSTVSITQYRVEGKLTNPVIDTVADGLKQHVIREIDNEATEKSVGWTTLEQPFEPEFERERFVIGSYFVFSLRIDRKTVPSKILKKHYLRACSLRLKGVEREFLSRNEKSEIKDQVRNSLVLKIPATPNVYDVVWNYENGELLFFTTQKMANEELETMFIKSFDLRLIRLFPYTMSDLMSGLSDMEKDRLSNLTPSRFVE
jgi:DNA recombination-dependent growth factor C